MFRKPKRKASTRGDRASTNTKEEEGEEGAAGSADPASAAAEDGEEAPAPEGGDWEGSRGAGREGEDEDEGGPSSDLFRRKKKPKPPVPAGGVLVSSASSRAAPSSGGGKAAGENRDLMHSYAAASGAGGGGGSGAGRPTHAELATRAAEHHAAAAGSAASSSAEGAAGKGPDGIFRNAARNKFAAGPIRAQTNVRVTARFDYQPDVCKDYKDTGFCGFGDTCIYLHDRGDTLSGWQIERAWEEDQKKKRRALEEEQMRAFAGGAGGGGGAAGASSALVAADDGLPFACYLCRGAFKDPVVTNCQHYFCQSCVLEHVRGGSDKCPVCGRDTHSVFNQPTKLLAKMRRVARSAPASGGGGAAKSPWQAYYDAMAAPKSTADEWE
jgi:RING finger protein 113A